MNGELTPRKNNLVINSVELHMLQTPSLVYPLWNDLLLETLEIGSMEHAYLNTLAMFAHQVCK